MMIGDGTDFSEGTWIADGTDDITTININLGVGATVPNVRK